MNFMTQKMRKVLKMGTRNMTMVYDRNGELKVAQYGQWDGYPECTGRNVLNFLKTEDLRKFQDQLEKCRFITDEELKKAWFDVGADVEKNDGFVSLQASEDFSEKYPELSRDTGYDILWIILNSDKEEIGLKDRSNFVNDSLFCEWAYVIDFQKEIFEVYAGFNMVPLGERDRFYRPDGYCKVANMFNDKKFKPDQPYYPVRIVCSYYLSELPEDEDKFVKTCEKGAVINASE
jgi:hypothetical protein